MLDYWKKVKRTLSIKDNATVQNITQLVTNFEIQVRYKKPSEKTHGTHCGPMLLNNITFLKFTLKNKYMSIFFIII